MESAFFLRWRPGSSPRFHESVKVVKNVSKHPDGLCFKQILPGHFQDTWYAQMSPGGDKETEISALESLWLLTYEHVKPC